MKYVFIVLASMLLTTGCSKKEFKSNWQNIKQGTKKNWKQGKENVSDATKEYSED